MGEEIDVGDESATLTTIRDLFRLYIDPEVIRRQDLGLIPRPFQLRAAQVIWFAEDRAPEVRLNEQVRAMALVQVGRPLGPREAIYKNDIEDVHEIRLTDDDDPNAGHATLIQIKGHWVLAFDCTYNKARATTGMAKAHEFLAAAATALENRHLSAFCDNLFSAAELAARAELLLTPDPDFIAKTNHRAVHSRINRESHLGNVSEKFVQAFNRLSTLRDEARYSHQPIKFDEAQCSDLLQTVSDEIAALRASRLREQRSQQPTPVTAASPP